MIVIEIEPGICGFRTMVQASRVRDYQIEIYVESDCSQVTELGTRLNDMAMRDILKVPIHHNPVYETAGRCRVHPSCPVPCGIIKAAEAAFGLALEKDVKIEFKKDV